MRPARYRIVRAYQNSDDREVIVQGLTLEQARRHCRDPETSSSTAKSLMAQERTMRMGPWFDGYEEET